MGVRGREIWRQTAAVIDFAVTGLVFLGVTRTDGELPLRGQGVIHIAEGRVAVRMNVLVVDRGKRPVVIRRRRETGDRIGRSVDVVAMDTLAIGIEEKQSRHPPQSLLDRGRQMNLFGYLIGPNVIRLKNCVQWVGGGREEIAGVGMPETRNRTYRTDGRRIIDSDEAAPGFRVSPGFGCLISSTRAVA